jgi:hypothetical protein
MNALPLHEAFASLQCRFPEMIKGPYARTPYVKGREISAEEK